LFLGTLSTLPEESTFDFSSFQVEPIAPSTSDSTKQNSRAESPTPPASTSEQETPKLNRRKSLLQTQSKFLNPADSFVFLSNSQILPSSLTTSAFAPSYPSALAKMAQESSKTNNNMSDRLKNLSRIFDLLNSEQQFDQPMCQDCTELLLEVLHKKLAGFSTERDVYQAYVKQIDQEVNGQTKPSKVTTKDIEKVIRFSTISLL
jgi:beclin 1